ncbi:MAG: hypothetical protein AAF518_28745 [Spirochaetota bacterium]
MKYTQIQKRWRPTQTIQYNAQAPLLVRQIRPGAKLFLLEYRLDGSYLQQSLFWK